MSHRHFCDSAGHYYKCGKNCECICGLPMEQGDHSECPVELKACPKHKDATEQQVAEPESGSVQIDFSTLSPERQQSRPHCDCGCADADPGNVVGFCLWCDHVYVEYTPKIADKHFAHHCPGAPDKLKQASLARLAKRRT